MTLTGRSVNIRERHSRIDVPAYNMSGWFDIFLGGSAQELHRDARERSDGGGEERATAAGGAVVPRRYAGQRGRRGGLRAECASAVSFDFQGTKLRWYDYWLKGEDNGVGEEDPVRIFVMGANEWRSEKEWPLARTQYTDYYLHSGGRANSVRRVTASLSTEAPADEPYDAYLYNPNNPVPDAGWGLVL